MPDIEHQEAITGGVTVRPVLEQLPATVQNGANPAHKDPASKVEVAEKWIDLIGWRLFGVICLILMFLQMAAIFQTGLPAWVLLALTGAGLGGKKLADAILHVLVATGNAAATVRSDNNPTEKG